MDPLFIIIPAIGVVCFACGILFSKVVLAETATVKRHVTDEVAKVRDDVASLLDKVKAKI
jgi:hypothetical protein